MLLHVLNHSVDVSEEAHMAQLVDLIMADRLNLQLPSDVLQVIQRCRKRRDSASRERDL